MTFSCYTFSCRDDCCWPVRRRYRRRSRDHVRRPDKTQPEDAQANVIHEQGQDAARPAVSDQQDVFAVRLGPRGRMDIKKELMLPNLLSIGQYYFVINILQLCLKDAMYNVINQSKHESPICLNTYISKS